MRAAMTKILTFILLTVFAFSVYAAESLQYKSIEEAVNTGKRYLSEKRYEQAYNLFMELLMKAPDNDTVNISFAQAAMLTKRPNQAIMAYERLIIKYPGNKDFQKGIAQAYIAIGDNATARWYLEMEDTLKKEAGRAQSPFEVRGSLRAGSIYDSNANQGPTDNTLKLGGYSLTLKDAKGEDSLAAYFGANIEGAYHLPGDTPLSAVGDLGVYIKNNFSERLKDVDRDYSQYYRLALGMRLALSSALADARLKVEAFDYNFYQTVYIYGAEINSIVAVGKRVHFITSATGDKRDYVRSGAYSGLNLSVGEYARFFLNDAAHNITVGGRYILVGADEESFSYDGWEASVQGGFSLPFGIRLSPRISWTKQSYDGTATVLETENREDSRVGVGLNIGFMITETLFIDAAYQYINNSSNSELYDYERQTLSLGVDWRF
jgi:tetratricopeptide (TPR) repeat protein